MSTRANRRSFLKSAGLSLLGAGITMRARNLAGARIFTASEFPAIRNQLVNLVNDERGAAGVRSLKLDEFASLVAEKHAIEMAQHGFLSHWGLDGRKPYHRYSFAGGTEAIEENDGSTDHTTPVAADDIVQDAISMHKSMHNELPPNDGHRQTILAPQHTHVGFGIALRGLYVRLTELYVARYIAIDPYPQHLKPRTEFILSGRVFDPTYEVQTVDVFYEALPSRPQLAWLQIPRPYGLPDDRDTLMPKLPLNKYYEDGSTGTIQFYGRGRFRVPITVGRRSGIYTMVTWIQRPKSDAFPATQVCVRVE
jgi:uncharacterized protein YkwD